MTKEGMQISIRIFCETFKNGNSVAGKVASFFLLAVKTRPTCIRNRQEYATGFT
jgi:hypothetical protein